MYGPVHTYSPPLAPGPRTERPGAGLALAAAGIVLGLLCLLTLPWAEGGGETATFMDIRDAVSGAPDPTDIVTEVGWWYLSWAAFTAFAVVVGLALMATIGLR